ncbi:MAG: M14 family zinc carboxypeptidase [Bacteriovoracales bacterium]|nr:M14 family zinc carboxypeptidase [Bacteriovoracales bacterium]
MKSFVLGKTRGGLTIPAHSFGNRGPRVLLLGGVHGDEPEGVALAMELWGKYAGIFPHRLQLILIPVLNRDGLLARSRGNGAGVDLNRNLPTKDWKPTAPTPRYHPGRAPNSESENLALTALIESFRPVFIISFHSFHRYMVNVNGDCRREAELISEITGYPVYEDMGYPTPGSLGTYAGQERDIPTITYELKKGAKLGPLLPLHIKAVDACLQLIGRTRSS